MSGISALRRLALCFDRINYKCRCFILEIILFRILELSRQTHRRSPALPLGTLIDSVEGLSPKTGQEPNGDLDALDLICLGYIKLALHEVFIDRLLVITVSCHLVFLALLGLYASLSHQFSRLITTHRKAQSVQCLLHPAAAIAIVRAFGYVLNPFQHLLVL